MTPPMLRQLRHDVWATDQLMAYCRSLSAEQLELTVPGTYGTIRATLAHIMSSDEGYLTRLLGVLLHEPPFRHADAEVATLDELTVHLAHVKEGVERLFASGEFDPDRLIRDTPLRLPGMQRVEVDAWVPLAQLVQHGSDHRAQIGTILGAHGLEAPDLDVWAYAIELGAFQKAEG